MKSKGRFGKYGGMYVPETLMPAVEELEKALAKVESHQKVFIKERIFENLKDIFGKDVEILVNY